MRASSAPGASTSAVAPPAPGRNRGSPRRRRHVRLESLDLSLYTHREGCRGSCARLRASGQGSRQEVHGDGSGKRKSVFSGLLPHLYEDDGQEEAGVAPVTGSEGSESGDSAEGEQESFEDQLRSSLKGLGLDLGEKVGVGSVADIYVATDAEGDPTAVKVLREDFRRRRKAQALFKKEATIALQLNHPNIVKVYHYEPSLHYMVQEYCDGGSLYGILADQRSASSGFPILNAPEIALDLAKAVTYLHKVGVVHRDLKSLNVLIGQDSETGERRAKICDFGSALLLSSIPSEYYWKPVGAGANKNVLSRLATDLVDTFIGAEDEVKEAFEAVGTPYWMAPEMLDPKVLDSLKLRCELETEAAVAQDTPDAKVVAGDEEVTETLPRPCLDLREITKTLDAWSFGVVLWEIFHKAHPWFEEESTVATRDEVRRIIVDEERRLPLASYLCREIQELIAQCWSADAYQRPALEKIFNTLVLVQQYDLSGSIDIAAQIAKAHLLTPQGKRIYLGDQER